MHSFEFDGTKSLSNQNKHGLSFEEIQVLWQDPDLIEIPAMSEGEARYLVVGKIADKHWSAVITYREANIRIISARRSRETEVVIYES